ncbi:hypothetical protein [Lacrimispora saccharolytica]|uniref:hypothetical protein n=1 Tax=Lacrimispora saccharolytica TaxID=84030 RepID=UPI000312FCE5|nr:hypothetical protein [Lacrimispora saccharolytica]QRV19507.1 hypothetical protein I6K70_19035 [Lacrimispora saccharolytica]
MISYSHKVIGNVTDTVTKPKKSIDQEKKPGNKGRSKLLYESHTGKNWGLSGPSINRNVHMHGRRIL